MCIGDAEFSHSSLSLSINVDFVENAENVSEIEIMNIETNLVVNNDERGDIDRTDERAVGVGRTADDFDLRLVLIATRQVLLQHVVEANVRRASV